MKNIYKILHINKEIVTVTLIGVIYQIVIAIVSLLINNSISDLENNSFNLNDYLISIPITLILLILFSFLYPVLSRILYANSKKNMTNYLMQAIFKKKNSFFKTYDSASVTNLIDNVGNDVSYYYADLFPNIIVAAIAFVLNIFLLFYFNVWVAIFVILFIIIVSILFNKVASILGKYQEKVIDSSNNILSELKENVVNFRIIKMLNVEKYYYDKYKTDYQNDFHKNYTKLSVADGIYTFLYGIINYILPFIVLLIGILVQNYLAITIGALMAIYTIIGNIQEPIRQFSIILSSYKKNKANVAALEPLLKNENITKQKINVFDNLSFISKGLILNNNLILENVNFTINKNDFAILKGPSGCGKSTIFKYLLGEEENNNISIKVNNLPTTTYSYDVLAVSQEIYLFHDTILANITCGTNYSKNEINEIIEYCKLSDFIKNYGYEKIIDNDSSNVSGGEKQRICLARILLRKPQLLLLDEVTASLDEKNATEIAHNIYKYCKENQITVIAVSHKNEFDGYSNKIINL